jgi:hypothetical protein
MYAAGREEDFVLRKLQRGLKSTEMRFEYRNIEINENTQVSTSPIVAGRLSSLALNGRNIPFLNSVKYLDAIFDRKITWRLHLEVIEIKTFKTILDSPYSKVSA